MRVLLDENLPVDLAGLLGGHDVQTVIGWSTFGRSSPTFLPPSTAFPQGDCAGLVPNRP